jgi:hypothetical protein
MEKLSERMVSLLKLYLNSCSTRTSSITATPTRSVTQTSQIPRKRNDCVRLVSPDIRHRKSSCRKKKRKTKKESTWSRRVSNEEYTPASWAADE